MFLMKNKLIKADGIFFKGVFGIWLTLSFIIFIFSIVAKPYVEKLKEEKKILRYMYRDDLSSFSKKRI